MRERPINDTRLSLITEDDDAGAGAKMYPELATLVPKIVKETRTTVLNVTTTPGNQREESILDSAENVLQKCIERGEHT